MQVVMGRDCTGLVAPEAGVTQSEFRPLKVTMIIIERSREFLISANLRSSQSFSVPRLEI
jgi:hypothetical protein